MGLHNALFLSIAEFSLFCFSQSSFFPEVGDTGQEQSPTPWDARVPGIWLMDFTKHGGRVTEEHSRVLIPRNSERYQVALDMAWLMARFVWLHEFSHCFNGHVDLVKSRRLAHRLYELPLVPKRRVSVKRSVHTIEDNATLKCLEFDADQSAFWACFNIQMHGLENIEDIRGLDKELRLSMNFFAAYASVWLIEQYQGYLGISENSDHPEPQLRLQNLFRTARDYILKRHPEVAPLHSAAINQFDAVAARIPTMYSTARFAEMISDPGLLAQLEAFDPRMQTLKQELRDFEFSENQK